MINIDACHETRDLTLRTLAPEPQIDSGRLPVRAPDKLAAAILKIETFFEIIFDFKSFQFILKQSRSMFYAYILLQNYNGNIIQ